jgi:ketosteroid isomerase-like protein
MATMVVRVLALGVMLSGVLLGATVSAQTPDPQVMAPIRTFADTFNKGDVAGAAATHSAAADLVIIDEPPPFVWHGAQAFQAWVNDLATDEKARGITDQHVDIGKPSRVEIKGDSAYVVAPSVYSFKEKGVAMRESAQMTFVLKKEASGSWLIHGWTWTGPRASRAAPKPKS